MQTQLSTNWKHRIATGPRELPGDQPNIGSMSEGHNEVACWVSTGERQAARIRGLYLRAILRQDISFFDKETNTGEVVGRMSGDTLLIQEALGEKVGKFIQCVACFLGGLVIAFIKGWLLTLVLLSCIPPLVISGSMMSFAFEKLASRGQAAYSEAATVVERTIGSIRQLIGLVSQEPILFSCSIKENIAYGKDGATNEEIRAATELANAAKFIDRFPHGVDTIVGEHATQLSGGQKQRIAIAMAILKDPRILQVATIGWLRVERFWRANYVLGWLRLGNKEWE
ncbi:hypothetical protein JHK87_015634 [Glycine soja]|nr:hypothetical protein JHK87_015634 [Glycine soja]